MNTIKFYRATGEYGFLSNLYPCRIMNGTREFPTVEHAYQYGKFKDKEVAEWVMKAPKHHLVCIVAHNLFSWDIIPGWSKIKVERMKQLLQCKFLINDDLAKKLVETGDAVLIEDSKTDAFWGIGKKGTGKNMLGRLLMEIREELLKKAI